MSGTIAWTACPGCYRFICEKCFDFICCGFRSAPQLAEKKVAPPVSKSVEIISSTMTEERNQCRAADAAVSVSPLLCHAIALLFLPQYVKVCSASYVRNAQKSIANVATCSAKSTSAPVEPDRVTSMAVSATSVKKNDQVECIGNRNYVHINDCGRYTSLADLCVLFAIEKKESKRERQARKKSKLDPPKDRSSTSSPVPSSLQALSTSADARYKTELFGGGSAQASDAYKITPGHTI